MNRSTTRTSLVATVSLLAAAATAPAVASPTRNEDGAPATSSAPTYATPLDALDGMSFAGYLAEHFASDPRLR
jgi:hypothetical protein